MIGEESFRALMNNDLDSITAGRTLTFPRAFFSTVTLLSVGCAGLALVGCSGASKDTPDPKITQAEEEAALSPWLTGVRPKRETGLGRSIGGDSSDDALSMARSVLGGAVMDDPVTENERLGLWSIVITVLRGQGAEEAAREAQAKIAGVGVRGTYVEKRGESTVVAFGRYEDPASDEAQMDLIKIRATIVDGEQPFLGAALTPPPYESIGTIPQYNLTVAKDAGPNRKSIYTLQVAQYGRSDNKPSTISERNEFRRAAEQAAVALRREGEEAFYFHGPRMSVVSIGMFNDTEYRTQNKRSLNNPESTVMLTRPVESMEIKQLRMRQPYNLVNGAAMKTRTRGDDDAQIQRSMMVEIPR